MQALSDMVAFVERHGRPGGPGLHALAPAPGSAQSRELAQVQWRVAALVERIFWSLCQSGGQPPLQPSRAAAARSLNAKVLSVGVQQSAADISVSSNLLPTSSHLGIIISSSSNA